MTQPRIISRRPLLLAVLLFALLPVVAGLQYYWVSELSQSERVRMQATLNSDIARLSADIDRELLQLYRAFQLPPGTTLGDTPDALSARATQWMALSETPEILYAIYWFRLVDQKPQLYIFDPATQSLEASGALPLPSASLSLHTNPEQMLTLLHTYAEPFTRLMPLMASPTANREAQWPPRFLPTESAHEFVFFALDMRVLENQVLPRIVETYFPSSEATVFDIWVANRDALPEVRYRSDSTLTLTDFAQPDATAEIGVPDWLGFLRQTVADSMSVPMLPFLARRPGIRGTTPTDAETPNSFPRTWTLYAKHQAGSVDAIATQLMQRNLAVSFGVLVILGGAIGLIVRATRQAQELANRQLAFVANVSHELRTPIAVMHAAGENLRDGLVTDAEESRAYGTLITQESENLQTLVEGALTYAGVGQADSLAGIAPVQVTELVEDALFRLRGIRQASQRIERELPSGLPAVHGDAKALATALQNVIHNALKYGGPDVRVRIHAWQEGNSIRIAVDDNGPGIPTQERKNIFTPFFRGQLATKLKIRGNGLGLSIVQRVVEAHHGTVLAEPLSPHGTSFQLTLPVHQQEVTV
ncbi:MAG: hypothetical protein RhofKO_22690 [Rhodothermales bacterium]